MHSLFELLHHSDASKTLKSLVDKCDLLKDLENRAQEFLNRHTQGQFQVLNVREHIIVVQAENAAYATRMRFLGEELIEYLKNEHIREVKIVIKTS